MPKPERSVCYKCEGKRTCDKCKGRGRVISSTPVLFGGFEDTCVSCDGTGKCQRCYGEGYYQIGQSKWKRTKKSDEFKMVFIKKLILTSLYIGIGIGCPIGLFSGEYLYSQGGSFMEGLMPCIEVALVIGFICGIIRSFFFD